jgi:hypothetical protein
MARCAKYGNSGTLTDTPSTLTVAGNPAGYMQYTRLDRAQSWYCALCAPEAEAGARHASDHSKSLLSACTYCYTIAATHLYRHPRVRYTNQAAVAQVRVTVIPVHVYVRMRVADRYGSLHGKRLQQ